ncbi:hypothetical protein [Propioniciclava sinopodophylli]|uniref:hypothetical protein n=1 Tax=Propioniciclava sinopodophylli TaxID=1837344 RepID=UPI0024902F3E|nr:hypothetical protein [Propioniciclava sinopodophylli]
MTATVGSLLDRILTDAWALSREFAEPCPPAYVESRARSVLVAWSAVARASVRAVEAAPLGESSWLPRTSSVRACLGQVIQAAPVWRASGRPGSDMPDRGMVEVARVIGAIADLLSDEPRAMTDEDRAAALGVQASVLTPVHALAMASLPVLEATGGWCGSASCSGGSRR